MGNETAEYDIEKARSIEISDSSKELQQPALGSNRPQLGRFQKWNARVEALAGFEVRGLERVPSEERQPPSTMGLVQMLLLWFSANITINNLAVALTGPLVFGLGFKDCAWCVVVGVFLGSSTTAYMATWGAESGNRTMVSVIKPLRKSKDPSLALVLYISALITSQRSHIKLTCHAA